MKKYLKMRDEKMEWRETTCHTMKMKLDRTAVYVLNAEVRMTAGRLDTSLGVSVTHREANDFNLIEIFLPTPPFNLLNLVTGGRSAAFVRKGKLLTTVASFVQETNVELLDIITDYLQTYLQTSKAERNDLMDTLCKPSVKSDILSLISTNCSSISSKSFGSIFSKPDAVTESANRAKIVKAGLTKFHIGKNFSPTVLMIGLSVKIRGC